MNNTANDSELVIGIIKTAGTNIKQVKDNINDRLNQYNYTNMVIEVSKEIMGHGDRTLVPPYDGNKED